MRILLASKSPRRRELVSQLGYPVEIVRVDVDEQVSTGWPSNEVAERLAQRKAEAFDTDSLQPDDVLLTADTVVVLDGQVLGKPHTREEATAMLHRLSNHTHTVYTGVCLRTINRSATFTEATTVHFARLSDSMIDHYIDHYQPYDKAGAYGIQEWIGMVGIRAIEGCYYNVMGLPVARIYAELQRMGLL